MSYFMRMFDKCAEEEDELLEKYLDKLYGPLIKLSAILPLWKRPHFVASLAIFGFHIFALGCNSFLLAITTFLTKDDFTLSSLSAHFLLLYILVILLIIFLNGKRSELAQIHRIMARDLFEYRTGRIYDEDVPQMMEKGKRAALLKFLILPAMVLLLASGVMVVPYAKKLSEQSWVDNSQYTESGVNLVLPMALYYPFPTNYGIMHGFAVICQCMGAASIAVVVVTMEIILFMVAESITFEYRVLQYAVESIFTRARTLHKSLNSERGDIKHVSDSKFQRCLEECFKDCINHHYRIKEQVGRFQGIVKWGSALAYGICICVIGLSLVNILNAKDSADYENMALFGMLLVTEVLNVYIMSIYGQNIRTEVLTSEILKDALYSINWTKLDSRNRKIFFNFLTGVSKPAVVKLGGGAEQSMETFSSAMNTAYSFFNLMNIS